MSISVQRFIVKATPSKSNKRYYEWQTATIVMFIPENNKKLAIDKARKTLVKNHWDLISFENKSTLIEERVREEGGEVWEAYRSAKNGEVFFLVSPDHFGAGTDVFDKTFKLFRPCRITETFIDSIIQDAGGKRFSEINANVLKNADYLIGDFIFELKDLQEEGLKKKPHQAKLAKLFIPYFPNQSQVILDASVLSKGDYRQYLDIISLPIQSQVKSASKQIKSTRDIMKNPNLKGGIIFLNTGYGSFSHDEFAKQVERYAMKDSSQFTAIVSISVWMETNGLDSYVYHDISPKNTQYDEVLKIKDSFIDLFEQMMTNLVTGKISDSVIRSTPLNPLAFHYEGIDFFWSPPYVPLPWEVEN